MNNPVSIIGPDNGSPMYGDPANVARCSSCGFVTQGNYVNPAFKLKRRKYDLSYTTDGCCIVTSAFVNCLGGLSVSGLRYASLPSEPGYFRLLPERILKFDSVRRNTQFLDICSACGRFDTVMGSHPCYLIPGQTIEPAVVYRTDLEFGSGDEKHPVLIAGPEAAKKMRESRLSGVDYEDVTL